MRRAFAVMSIAAACAASVNANELRLFFSATPWSPGMPSTPEIWNPVVDCSGGPVTMYLWAQTNKVGANWDIWQGISLDLVGPRGESGVAYNPADEGTDFVRWEGGSTLTWTDTEGMYAVGVSTGGVGSGRDPMKVDDTSTTRFFPIAEITFQPELSEVYLAIGSGGIARRGGDSAADVVYFGAGDDPVHVNDFGAVSSVPDLTMPEPGSLLLLSLAALIVRRR